MRGPKKEQWMRLCELIAEEQDPVRFSELTKQLLAELEVKDNRLKSVTKEKTAPKPAKPDQNTSMDDRL